MQKEVMPDFDPYNINFNGHKLDPYRVIDLFQIAHPAIQQAVKKLLRCGAKHKTPEEDVRDCITSCQRFLDMKKEEADWAGQPQLPLEEAGELMACHSCGGRLVVSQGVDGVCPLCVAKTEGKCADCGKPTLPGESYCGTCFTEPGPR